jgi:thiol-disulfide isomerase/thioredoxin
MARAFLRPGAFVAISACALIAHAGEPSPPSPGALTPAPLSGAPLAAVLAGPPWLGVTMNAGGDIGVTVEHVVRGSPADKGGVRAGDRIVGIDGAKVTLPGSVSRAVGGHKIGETVSVELERRGAASTAAVVLAARPSGDQILKMDLVGAPAPPWSNVTPLAGAPAAMEKLRGRVVILDFWATWCAPCRLLAPRLSALRDRFGAQGLSVVGLTTEEAEKAAVYAERIQMRYGVVIDKDGETSRAYGVTALPTMLIIDKKGVIRDAFIGYDPSSDARVEAEVKALLAEPGPAPSPSPSPSPSEERARPPAPAAARPPAR